MAQAALSASLPKDHGEEMLKHVPSSTRRSLARVRSMAKQRLTPAQLNRRSAPSRTIKLPKHTAGHVWNKVLKTPIQSHNKSYRIQFQLTFLALNMAWPTLLLCYFAAAFAFAAIFASFFWAGDCASQLSFAQVFLIVAQQIMTGPAFMEITDRTMDMTQDRCIGIGFLSSTFALGFQTFVLSVAIRKYMKPKSTVAFSRKLVFNTRNGVPCLQARIVNLRGTFMSNIRLKAVHAYPVTTLEGEKHWKVDELKFRGPHFFKLPGTYTHELTKESPLYEDYKKRTVTGTITFEFVGYDGVLHEDIHQIWMFTMPKDARPCSRFADMVTKGVTEAIADGTYQYQLDMGNFDAVVPTHDNDRCCMLCMRGCAFGSAAKNASKGGVGQVQSLPRRSGSYRADGASRLDNVSEDGDDASTNDDTDDSSIDEVADALEDEDNHSPTGIHSEAASSPARPDVDPAASGRSPPASNRIHGELSLSLEAIASTPALQRHPPIEMDDIDSPLLSRSLQVQRSASRLLAAIDGGSKKTSFVQSDV
eukprot:TRINITY_DN12404_c4_g2_i1.p1 TRINITY_DN12404_c4_g2~~TRINITY_DN12404_c4_g2_i1.p1  ORF type:complete len:534 (+),score=91.56 TRINITY_DN12404_c4_g2_i1:224-1825(+)